MSAPPIRAVLPDGRRRHFQHGPIDLVIEAFGGACETEAAYGQAWARFETILGELGEEVELEGGCSIVSHDVGHSVPVGEASRRVGPETP